MLLAKTLRWFGRQQRIECAQPLGMVFTTRRSRPEIDAPTHERARVSSSNVPGHLVGQGHAFRRAVVVGLPHPATLPPAKFNA